MENINVRHQQKIDSAINWESKNPILLNGEIGIDFTNNIFKIGDGTTPWKSIVRFFKYYEEVGDYATNSRVNLIESELEATIDDIGLLQTGLNNANTNILANSTNLTNHNTNANSHYDKFNTKFDIINSYQLFKDVEYVKSSGNLIFTRYDDTIVELNLPLESIVKRGYIDEDLNTGEFYIVLVLADDSEIRFPATALIKDFDGKTTDTIQILVSDNNVISANVVKESITKDLLSVELQNIIDSSSSNRVKKYIYSFNNTTDWNGTSTYNMMISSSVHGVGTDLIADVFILEGSNYKKSYGYPSEGWDISVDSVGNVVLSTTTKFAGKIVILG